MTVFILPSDKYTSRMKLTKAMARELEVGWIRYSYVTPLFSMKVTGWDIEGTRISLAKIYKLKRK